jgi:hypothetical protein
MIINLWSTPRTGSNWYAQYLAQEQQKLNSKVLVIHQYLNSFHFINYIKPNYSDYVYEFSNTCMYPSYQYDVLKQSVVYNLKFGQRLRNPEEEEKYRIELLEKHNHAKTNLILHNHILPMSTTAYNYLFNKADKNIFLYRENIIDQLSSYALAYTTSVWRSSNKNNIFENINTDKNVIKNLFDRIVYWYKLDKSNCEIIKYEDIDFNYTGNNMPKKQNIVSAFSQLDTETQNYILDLANQFNKKLINSEKTL